MALSAPEIVARVKAGKGPQDLYSAHDAAANFARKHDEITGKIEALQRRMSGSWTGNAADQARVGAGPLLEASKVAAGHLATAQSLYLGQGDSFRGLKAEVDQNDPGPKPASTWWSDTVPFLSSRDEEIDTWNQKAQVIVESYSGYHTESSANSAGWPKEYGQLGLPPGGAPGWSSSPRPRHRAGRVTRPDGPLPATPVGLLVAASPAARTRATT